MMKPLHLVCRSYAHVPVLLNEVLSAWVPYTSRAAASPLFCDLTAGGGGHSYELLRGLPHAQLLCMDRDAEAVQAVTKKLQGLPHKQHSKSAQQWHVHHGSYVELEKAAELAFGRGTLFHGILADLGVSSHQLDTAERGFSFKRELEGPLDMRFCQEPGTVSAADLIHHLAEADLAAIFRDFGEEKHAKAVASAITAARQEARIATTTQLAEIVEAAVQRASSLATRRGASGRSSLAGGRQKAHPATKVFQALRIAVNKELQAVHAMLDIAPRCLAVGGRLAIITFHSLEDRMVKQAFQRLAEDGMQVEGREALGERQEGDRSSSSSSSSSSSKGGKKPKQLLRFALAMNKHGLLEPGEEEVQGNPRARSAKLRVLERTA